MIQGMPRIAARVSRESDSALGSNTAIASIADRDYPFQLALHLALGLLSCTIQLLVASEQGKFVETLAVAPPLFSDTDAT